MKQLHQGLDYRLYKIYVWGGLALLVVHIVVSTLVIETMDKHSLTVVQAKVPEFKVQSNEGKLVPNEGAPEAVVKALKSLRQAKRWRGIVVYAGPEGMAIQRHSTGTNMWLYDLWLAEYLLDKIQVQRGLAVPH